MDLIERIRSSKAGKLGELIAGFDWSATAMGPMESWPDPMTMAVCLLAESTLPIVTLWGQHGILIYNDAYVPFAGSNHPILLGMKATDAWPEAMDLHRRILRAGLAGEAASLTDAEMSLIRHGEPETILLDLDYCPIRDDEGKPVGVFAVLRETTERFRLALQRAADVAQLDAARLRQRYLMEFGEKLRECDTAWKISGAVSEILGNMLNCSRAGYATMSGHYARVENDWTRHGGGLLSGRHEFSSLGRRYVDALREGKILAVSDVRNNPITAQGASRWASIKVTALLNVPLLQNGVLAGLLYAHDSQARVWTHEEILLVREIAERAWQAMSRAQAVETLRQMNVALEGQVRDRTIQLERMWALSTEIMMATSPEGKILAVNPAWTRAMGWQESEVIGTLFFEFIHPDDIELTHAERRKIEAGHMIERFENRYINKDGRAIWLSWNAVPDIEVIHSVARDVTAEREQANALRAAEDALRQAQKMEAVGQLTGGIAHDFNNMLQGIVGALDLSQKRVEQGRMDGLNDYIALARSSADRAIALTHRLLAFSRRQPLDPRPADVNALILAMEPLLRRTVGEAILLEFDLDQDLWLTLCDSNQLDSAILNLAINARDAMPKGGRLTFRSVNAANIEGGANAASGDYICLSVTDTGSGMAPEIIERAFDPFYTTKPLGQGTGLGLSMVYGFMRQSGGYAKITSHVGVGTTVALYFRRYAGRLSEIDPIEPAKAVDQVRRGQGAVLVVEDDPSVRSLIVDVLDELGFSITAAKDGPSGLAILQSNEPVDLLITDIGLPGLNGRQVAEAGRLIRPMLKVLFMTGYADSAVISSGFLGPGMEMIIKPFSLSGFAERVLKITDR